jgi:tetratricopeptide (TPR) repeat protein
MKQSRSRTLLRSVARWTRNHLALWLFFAGILDTALLTLVTVLIALPGQRASIVSSLVVLLIVLLALSVIFPIAGRYIDNQDRLAEQDRERRNRAIEQKQVELERIGKLIARGSSKQLPRLSELADDSFGVTPTRYSIAGQSPYIARRKEDDGIRSLLAIPGPPYPFVIVWGTTKVGKSRTLTEAIRAVFHDDSVVVLPRDALSLAEISRFGMESLVQSPPAVVVLDDLGPAGLEALTGDVLDSVRKWGVIAATMTAQRRADAYKTGGEAGAVARAALASASGEYEVPSGAPTGIERAEAERLYPEERFDGSIAETLVGAWELIARYKGSYDSHPVACAVLRAAIDCRRVGLSRPVKESELRKLFPLYLRDIRANLTPDPAKFREAISWLSEPIASQVSLLQRNSASSDAQEWTAFDHAVTADEGGEGNQYRSIPHSCWMELISIVSAQDTFSIGAIAEIRGEMQAATAAFRKASADSHFEQASLAALSLGFILQQAGDFEGARDAYQRGTDLEDNDYSPKAYVGLGLLLEENGRFAEAQRAYEAAINSGHADAAPVAAVGMGSLLADAGDAEGAKKHYLYALESGHPDEAPRAAASLGRLYWEEGDLAKAQTACQIALESGQEDAFPSGALMLGTVLERRGEIARARELWQEALESSHPDAAPIAAVNLGWSFREEDEKKALDYFEQAMRLGDPEQTLAARANVGRLLAKQGDDSGAIIRFKQVLESNNAVYAPAAAFFLGEIYAKQGHFTEARDAYQYAVGSENKNAKTLAATNLGLLLYNDGDTAGAEALWRQALRSHGDSTNVAATNLAELLIEQGNTGEAEILCRQALTSGNPRVASIAQDLLDSMKRNS